MTTKVTADLFTNITQTEINDLQKKHAKLEDFAKGGFFHNTRAQIINIFQTLWDLRPGGPLKLKDWKDITFIWTDEKIVDFLKKEAAMLKNNKSSSLNFVTAAKIVQRTAIACLSVPGNRFSDLPNTREDIDNVVKEMSNKQSIEEREKRQELDKPASVELGLTHEEFYKEDQLIPQFTSYEKRTPEATLIIETPIIEAEEAMTTATTFPEKIDKPIKATDITKEESQGFRWGNLKKPLMVFLLMMAAGLRSSVIARGNQPEPFAGHQFANLTSYTNISGARVNPQFDQTSTSSQLNLYNATQISPPLPLPSPLSASSIKPPTQPPTPEITEQTSIKTSEIPETPKALETPETSLPDQTDLSSDRLKIFEKFKVYIQKNVYSDTYHSASDSNAELAWSSKYGKAMDQFPILNQILTASVPGNKLPKTKEELISIIQDLFKGEDNEAIVSFFEHYNKLIDIQLDYQRGQLNRHSELRRSGYEDFSQSQVSYFGKLKIAGEGIYWQHSDDQQTKDFYETYSKILDDGLSIAEKTHNEDLRIKCVTERDTYFNHNPSLQDLLNAQPPLFNLNSECINYYKLIMNSLKSDGQDSLQLKKAHLFKGAAELQAACGIISNSNWQLSGSSETSTQLLENGIRSLAYALFTDRGKFEAGEELTKTDALNLDSCLSNIKEDQISSDSYFYINALRSAFRRPSDGTRLEQINYILENWSTTKPYTYEPWPASR